MTTRKVKARNFAFILYPESIPEDWKEKLETLDIPMAISPLHDKDARELNKSGDVWDLSPEELELHNQGKLFKKPHYHVMYMAPNPVPIESIRKKIKRKLGDKSISHIEIIDGVQSYFKYLTHESSDAIKKKKHKYDKNDIVYLSNFDIDRYITLDDVQKKEMFNAITKAIRAHGLANIFDLSDFIEKRGAEIGISSVDVMNDVISLKTGLLRMYFDGAYQRRKQQEEKRLSDEENKRRHEKMNEQIGDKYKPQ